MGVFGSIASALGFGGPKKVQRFKFRGIEFDGVESRLEGGRRVVLHEYPQRDDPSTDDMGRKARRWTIHAFLVGDNIQKRRKQLLEALEMGGQATLVHPRLGNLSVICETYEITDGLAAKTYTEFTMDFLDAGTVFKAPSSNLSGLAALCAAFRSTVKEFYAARSEVLALNRKVQRLLTGSLEERMVALTEITGQFTGTDVSGIVYAIEVINDTATTLSGDADALTETWDTGTQTLTAPADAQLLSTTLSANIAGTQSALAAGLATPTTTATDLQVLTNAAVLDMMLYSLAVAKTAELTAAQTFTSYEEATATAQALGDEMAAAEQFLDDPAAFEAASGARANMVGAILAEAIDLPHQQTITLTHRAPALVIAANLYDDAERAAEIVTRNNVADPGAVSGDIVVLTE